MGLIARAMQKRFKDPVNGTAKVVSGSAADPMATSQNYRIQCVVSGPGIEAHAVEHSGIASTSKWPAAGSVLPIVIDRAHPKNFVIQWGEVKTGEQAGEERAQAMAAAMQAGKGVTLGPSATVLVAGVNLNEALGASAGRVPSPSPAPVEERLKKLDALHDSGAITDEERATERQRILDAL